MKADAGLRQIPVVMMTASPLRQEATECANLYANPYVRKTVGLENPKHDLDAILGFWLETAWVVR